jgi:hypothetical protein
MCMNHIFSLVQIRKFSTFSLSIFRHLFIKRNRHSMSILCWELSIYVFSTTKHSFNKNSDRQVAKKTFTNIKWDFFRNTFQSLYEMSCSKELHCFEENIQFHENYHADWKIFHNKQFHRIKSNKKKPLNIYSFLFYY